MPGFADSFWSSDYAAGLGILFGKLQQGVIEDRQLLIVARMRAEAEEVYGQRLGDIPMAVDKVQGGFSRDDGASVRKAYEGVRTEMEDAARNHRKIAQNIRDLVVNPFSRWCDAHEARIQDSQDELQGRIKTHDRQLELVKKLRNNYFNKSRLLEDLEEENKLAFQDPETSPKANIPEIKVEKEAEPEEEEEPFEIGDETYPPEQVKKILAHMLNNIKLGETKVPILGTYQNTSAGSDIVEYLQKNMNTSSVSYAERIGQDLVTHGFLRLVGNVGNTFANSSKMFYQWRPRAFQLGGVPEKKATLGRTFSLTAAGTDPNSIDSPVIGTVNEYLEKWNVLGTAYPNETPSDRMRREAREADERYKAGVRKLDDLRCELEEAIFDHLRFLERCELDRLKAIKTVILDFSGTISNVIPSLQSTVDKLVLYQETVQPLGDLRYLLENYRTGSFIPKVVTYENYYNRVDEETFGVDLEARARADKKRVPIVVTTLLTYLDHHYPDLEGDEARRNVWLIDVPLYQVHKLRAKVNHGKTFSPDVLQEYDIPTIASLLKLYLRELPDSLVSSHVYEIIRTIYQTPAGGDAPDDAHRVPVLQQTLSQLRLTNIATLDACMNHFTRLIELTSADETYVAALATTIAPCVLRPRVESSLTMEERHAYRLVRDLFAHKDAIFSELKRLSALTHSSSLKRPSGGSAAAALGSGGPGAALGGAAGAGGRPRAISTDESHRKAHMEERTRALLEKANGSRSRATSPAPSPRASTHRRDRSIGGPETRFPIQTSPTSSGDRHRQSIGPILGIKRSSLEVPGDGGAASNGAPAVDLSSVSGGLMGLDASAMPADGASPGSPADRRNSVNRNSTRFVGGRRMAPLVAGSGASAAAAGSSTAAPAAGASSTSANVDESGSHRHSQHAVTLVDRPMAD
ncbi:Rho-GTPase-activating protein 8 [Sporothrix curviconia]|uniref:Rho-GTPase-activating protein 8 n=1 Tax=Sporothrix curviconia TaxID=1260050 RepID=A0ABP0BU01_9PEZI